MAVLALLLVLPLFADAGHGAAKPRCGCPSCGNAVCVPSREPEVDERYCWKVEFKQVCIPAIRWPWQSCCEPKCGKVKTVKVLEKVEYECDKCGYRWDVRPVGCCPTR